MGKQTPGFAKKQFEAFYQHAPWLKNNAKSTKENIWPVFDKLYDQKRLSVLEVALTRSLLHKVPYASDDSALFLCHLILAAKEGHLCIQIDGSQLQPSVEQLWQNEENETFSVDESGTLKEMIIKGALQLPESVLAAVQQYSNADVSAPICRLGNLFYLQKHYVYETLFLKHFQKHLENSPNLLFDIKIIENFVDQFVQDKILLQEQAQAIISGCVNSLTLLTGGPGTGKTYTAAHLVQTFWSNLSEEHKELCQIVLAAPTGKAAANLQRSVNHLLSSCSDMPPIQAKTLHSLLGIKNKSFMTENARLTADLIIVDESSMIDINLMSKLFCALKPGSRLILLGDPHQLPAVEAGNVFIDLINLKKDKTTLPFSWVHLSTCLRAELKSLVDFSQLIKSGEAEKVVATLTYQDQVGIKRSSLPPNKFEMQKRFAEYVSFFFPAKLKSHQPPEDFLNFFQSVRLLSPMRKGPYGVEALNQLIAHQVMQNTPHKGLIAIPIIIVTNDYQQDLYNGETGVLIRNLALHKEEEDYALFPSRQGGQLKRVASLLLPKYELAYCLSVHKSQGSEFDRVILVLPEGAERFGREVFYTAVTRAKKALEIFASDEVIFKTVLQQGYRLSGISSRLKEFSYENEPFSTVV